MYDTVIAQLERQEEAFHAHFGGAPRHYDESDDSWFYYNPAPVQLTPKPVESIRALRGAMISDGFGEFDLFGREQGITHVAQSTMLFSELYDDAVSDIVDIGTAVRDFAHETKGAELAVSWNVFGSNDHRPQLPAHIEGKPYTALFAIIAEPPTGLAKPGVRVPVKDGKTNKGPWSADLDAIERIPLYYGTPGLAMFIGQEAAHGHMRPERFTHPADVRAIIDFSVAL